MTRRSVLRAADADREHVAERLRHATAEGRLAAEELEERLGLALSARTYGELDAVVADLPAERGRRRDTVPLWAQATLVLAAALAVLVVAALLAAVLIGLAGAWVAWMVIAWLFFGRRGRVGRRGHQRLRASAVRASVPRARAPGGRPATHL
jgi:Domain of unknown function (DUF1707)